MLHASSDTLQNRNEADSNESTLKKLYQSIEINEHALYQFERTPEAITVCRDIIAIPNNPNTKWAFLVLWKNNDLSDKEMIRHIAVSRTDIRSVYAAYAIHSWEQSEIASFDRKLTSLILAQALNNPEKSSSYDAAVSFCLSPARDGDEYHMHATEKALETLRLISKNSQHDKMIDAVCDLLCFGNDADKETASSVLESIIQTENHPQAIRAANSLIINGAGHQKLMACRKLISIIDTIKNEPTECYETYAAATYLWFSNIEEYQDISKAILLDIADSKVSPESLYALKALENIKKYNCI